MHATSTSQPLVGSPKHATFSLLARVIGGVVLALIHGVVVFEMGKFIFLEYVADITNKYVYVTPEPHGLLEAFVAFAAIGALAALVPLLWWKRSSRWLLLSFAIVIVEVPLPTIISAQNTFHQWHGVDGAGNGKRILNDFYEEKKRFPASQQELDDAVAVQDSVSKLSHYARGSTRLPYRFVYVPNASGPHTPNPPGRDPVTVYCAVSADLQHYWTTGTGLRGAIGEEIDFARIEPGEVVVFDESVGRDKKRKAN